MAPPARLAAAFAQVLALSQVVVGYATPSDLRAREITARQAKQSYDYIVVGGGQVRLGSSDVIQAGQLLTIGTVGCRDS